MHNQGKTMIISMEKGEYTKLLDSWRATSLIIYQTLLIQNCFLLANWPLFPHRILYNIQQLLGQRQVQVRGPDAQASLASR